VRLKYSSLALAVVLALSACSTNSGPVDPTSTASPPETSFSVEAVVIVTQAFYGEYLNCMTTPPTQAAGQVGTWCASNNSNASSTFPANLEDGGVAQAGADPIVCAQSFPMSYKVQEDATYSVSEKSGTAFVVEQFGSGELVLTVLLNGKSDKLLVDKIVCPVPS